MQIDQYDRQEFFICESHFFENEVHCEEVEYNGKKWLQGFVLTLPVEIGPKSLQNKSTTSKGLDGNQTMTRILNKSKAIMDRGFILCDAIDIKDEASKNKLPKK
jgi:hypothetical protein